MANSSNGVSSSSSKISTTTESAVDILYDTLFTWLTEIASPILLTFGTIGNLLQFIVLSTLCVMRTVYSIVARFILYDCPYSWLYDAVICYSVIIIYGVIHMLVSKFTSLQAYILQHNAPVLVQVHITSEFNYLQVIQVLTHWHKLIDLVY